jgi:lipopolysaccharide export system permease protein
MRILRYLNREVLTHTVAVSFVLLVIIFSGRFVKYLAEAASGDIAADILLPVMLFRLPGFLELIIPLGLFIGILMSYGRLYVESEMVVLSACGVSPSQLALYTLVPATLVMLLVGSLSLYISPLGAARSEVLLDDPRSSQGLNAMAAGRFQMRKKDNAVSYAQSISAQTGVMSSVFLANNGVDEDGQLKMSVTVAEQGEVITDPETGARYLELRNGYRYEGLPGELDYQIVEFERFGELIAQPKNSIRSAAPVDGRATLDLWRSSSPQDRAALYWRVSIPLMVPIVAIIALCLSRTDHRRGRYVKMAPGFVVYLTYLVLVANGRASIGKGTASLWSGIGWVHAAFLLLALAMLFGPGLLRRVRYRRAKIAQA